MDISTVIAGTRFDNPVFLASGIVDETLKSVERAIKSGAGAAVTKSIGKDERAGYVPPIISELPTGMLNAVGLANPGIDDFIDEFKTSSLKEKIVVSIFGKDSEEFLELAKKVQDAGFTTIELNLSCPHVKGYGSEVGEDPELVEEIIKELKSKTNLKVWAKLTPNVTHIVDIAKAAERADALVLINTVKAIGVNIWARKFSLTNGIGGYSGPGIKPIALRAVYDVYKETGKELIGVGGITTYEDAIEFMLLGAKAIQVGTAIYYKDFKIFNEISQGIMNYLEMEGFGSLQEIIGLMVK